ncbi:type II toxin-antitoxin system Phd/YefM family antitoxin [Yersinia bercovieri]|uniref:type II toxin-antitoxin system Phd/YefM family antitoxin n=1 Tax=Yersinia bercovieri TaxID=634 RepID=UPI0011AB89D5|nr:type II toxin-antitoxin system Phd/YefM family antitoxin [Yersinia bercovieri]
MKEITYTRLRQDLANVLDEIRNGEEFLVTQRGKVPVKLGNTETIDTTKSDIHSIKSTLDISKAAQSLLKDVTRSIINAMNNGYLLNDSGKNNKIYSQIKEFTKSSNQDVVDYLKNTSSIKNNSINNNKMPVEDAVKEVRIRHAKTIKALEDK